MTTLLDTLRGTVGGVLGASLHLAWFVEYQSGNRRAVRPVPTIPGPRT